MDQQWLNAFLQVGIFSAEALVIFLAIAGIILLIALLAAKAAHKHEFEIEVLDKKYKDAEEMLQHFLLTKEEKKELTKKEKKEKKDSENTKKPRIYFATFNGDVQASAVENLREEITAILTVAQPEDEVVISVESPGGVVHGYGLAASQLMRVRDRQIPLTVCVDKVAASGGYLMSCTANKILSAPFAIIGSIGVVAQVPNFHDLLTKNNIKYKEYTAGEYKRTISVFGEITEKGEEKFVQQLEDTHTLFKNFVHKFRTHLDLSKVATGEYWFGEQALALGLVDELKTSDDYLLEKSKTHKIIKVKYEKKETLSDKLSGVLGKGMENAIARTWSHFETRRFF